ncbi:MAG: DNA polymerase [Candidatus Parcubacteria bacterium]|nr:MAG: DNA polymerase [Candidatus Parcubacteria bacterium]
MKLFLIDANAFIHRLYHALPRLGKPVQVIYGLTNLLLKFVQEYKPDYLFALYDRPEPTIRHLIFKEYKATRPETSSDLREQILLSKEVFEVFNIPVLEKIGYEADDLIASLKRKFFSQVEEIIILTGDFDTLQLVDEKTKVMIIQKGISQLTVYDQEKVRERFGVWPYQMVDYKALIGDYSDNIIGVPGVGEKTAARLLKEFGSLEKIIELAEKNFLDKNLREKILSAKEKLLFNKNLITLNDDLNLSVDLQEYKGFDREKLIEFCQRFNFLSILGRLGAKEKTDLFHSVEGNLFQTFFSWDKPFIVFFDDDQAKILDDQLRVKTLNNWDEIRKIFLSGKILFVFDLKNLLKPIIKNDYYFDRQINLNNFYDLRLINWLLIPDRGKVNFESFFRYWHQGSSLQETLDKLKEKLKELELEKLYFDLELPLTPILGRIELRGLKIDSEAIKKFKHFLKQKSQELLTKIQYLAGEKFNPNSTKELREILFKKLKIDQKKLSKTAKGEISTKEEELLKIVDVHPIIPLIIDYRKINKLANTYTDSLLKNFDQQSQRIFPIINQTGASTGRIIVEQPNLQSLPNEGELKKAFVVDDDYFFISADYSQLELRLLAHLSGDEGLISAFHQKIDIHSQTAKLVFGSDDEKTRQKAKMINFSITYGVTPRGLADRLQISVSDAHQIISRFFYFYPGVKKFNEELIDFAKTYGYAQTLFGRKKIIPDINSNSYRNRAEAERIAINMPIQGLAADILKKVIIEIDQQIYQKNLPAYIVLTIHDELIFEVKKEIKEEFKILVKEVMERVIDLKVPLVVNLKEGKNLAEV